TVVIKEPSWDRYGIVSRRVGLAGLEKGRLDNSTRRF
ncbi:hypothetical protein PanWU01x14_185730, partial [Parasponia andersonii]